MYSMIEAALLDGIRMVPVQVEVDIRSGLPAFEMVGYLTPEVREAKGRVSTALHNCGIAMPAKRITLNISPGNIRKYGTGFDLAIAVALLAALGVVDKKACEGIVFVGELNLSGQILPVDGIFPIVSDGIIYERTRFVIPYKNYLEGNMVKEATCYCFSHLSEVIDFLNGKPYIGPQMPVVSTKETECEMDFRDVNGQKMLKRASEIAAAGMHNLLMVGPPGAGKTMIAERISTILPPLNETEQLEITKIYSVSGLLKNENSLITRRPFRRPHHTVSQPGLVGGGMRPKPGEISLAHYGVLFLDELTEYRKETIETLRQPMEENKIVISRAYGSVEYPANFLLLAAMNPCNCGYYPDMQKCRCSQATLARYSNKISQPLLERIDLCVQADTLSYYELTTTDENESSKEIQQRVEECMQIQRKRFRGEDYFYNSQIPAKEIAKYCKLGEKEERYMENLYLKHSLTARNYHKILRVARTIADLDHSNEIQMKHLNEAFCYRTLDQSFWRAVS